MKKTLLLLLLFTQLSHAARSIGDAKRFFQASVEQYRKNPTAENAQVVVDEYASEDNTEKYRRAFDQYLGTKKLSMDKIRKTAATSAEAVSVQNIVSSGDADQDFQGLLKFAGDNGIQAAPEAQEVIQRYRKNPKPADLNQVYRELMRISKEQTGELAAAPAATTEAVEDLGAAPAGQRDLKATIADANANWSKWKTAQRKDFIAKLQQEDARAQTLLANLKKDASQAARPLQKTVEALEQAISENIASAQDGLASAAQVTFAAISQTVDDLKKYVTGLPQGAQQAPAAPVTQPTIPQAAGPTAEVGFDQMPDYTQAQAAELDKSEDEVLKATDPQQVDAGIAAATDLINAQDEDTPIDPDDKDVVNAEQAVDDLADDVEAAQANVDDLEVAILEQYGYLNMLDDAARAVTEAFDATKVGIAGTVAISTIAATAISTALGVAEELSTELKELANKFRAQGNNLTAEMSAHLVLLFEKASEAVTKKITAIKAQLVNQLLKVDEATIKLLQAETELKKQIGQNKKNAYKVLNRALDSRINEAKLELAQVKDAIKKIDANVNKIRKGTAKVTTGVVRMNKQVQAHYDKLKSTQNLLENRISGLETIRKNRGKTLQVGIDAIDNNIAKYVQKNDTLIKLLTDSKSQREAIKTALAQDKPLMAAAAADEAIAKLSAQGKQLAESFAEAAQEFKQGSKVTFNTVRVGLGRLSALPRATIQDVAPVIKDYMIAIRNDIQEAQGLAAQRVKDVLQSFSSERIYPDVKSIRAPKNFTVPTGLSQELTAAQRRIVDNANASIQKAQAKVMQAKTVAKQYAQQAKDILKEGGSKDAATIRQAVENSKKAAADLKESTKTLANSVMDYSADKLTNAAKSLRNIQFSQRTAQLTDNVTKLLKRVVK